MHDQPMSDSPIRVEHDGPVVTIRFNSPATMNALTMEMFEALAAQLREAEGQARAIILAGGDRAFCSGASLDADESNGVAGQVDAGESLEKFINPLMVSIRNLNVPLVTAIRGAAVGVGASLALAGDIIVAGHGAYFLQAFCRIGLVPDGGSSWMLNRAVGRVRAMDLMLLGDKLTAATAFEWGLVTRLVADEEVEATALALARRLAAGPTTALALIRKAAWAGADNDFEAQLQLERDFQRTAGMHPDLIEGINAFREKRSPRFNR